jgi:FkbM family methyltransferase
MVLSSVLGVLRSVITYYNPALMRRNRHLYSGLIAKGDLVFDVGAHVGTRARVLRACGARVVAFEPQPVFARFLRWTLPRDITLIEAALGRAESRAQMAVSRRHPTVSSLRDTLPDEARAMPGFEHVRWDDRAEVAVTTLDHMIALHGVPDYIKIDVEGFEPEVLAGLGQAVALISFEYLPALQDVSLRVLDRLEVLGQYEFNIVHGENAGFDWPEWQDADHLRAWLAQQHPDSGSGDVYARLIAAHPSALGATG